MYSVSLCQLQNELDMIVW